MRFSKAALQRYEAVRPSPRPSRRSKIHATAGRLSFSHFLVSLCGYGSARTLGPPLLHSHTHSFTHSRGQVLPGRIVNGYVVDSYGRPLRYRLNGFSVLLLCTVLFIALVSVSFPLPALVSSTELLSSE